MLNKKYPASVLVVTIMILGIVLATALSIATVSNKERNAAISTSQSNKAYQYADSGVEQVLQLIKDNSSEPISSIDNNDECDGVINSDDDSYRVELKNSDDDIITNCITPVRDIAGIKSIGTDGNTQRAIGASVWFD